MTKTVIVLCFAVGWLGAMNTARAQLQGSSGLPCYENGSCDPGLTCNAENVCEAAEVGAAGGACYGNGTCNAGLACSAERVCVAAETGALGGSCYGNNTCNEGLECDVARNTCAAGAPPPAPAAHGGATAGGQLAGTGPAGTGAAQPAAGVTQQTEPPLATSGGRSSIAVGLALPTGDFAEDDFINSSFFASVRLGKETITGNTGLTLGGRLLGVYWSNDADDFGDDLTLLLFHAGLEGRGAYHMGNKVLYASGTLGLDVSVNDQDGADNGIGFGMTIDAGIEFLTSPSSAFGVGALLHPGFTKVVDVDASGIPDVTFFGLYANYSTY